MSKLIQRCVGTKCV